jgi:rare lipoprotein A
MAKVIAVATGLLVAMSAVLGSNPVRAESGLASYYGARGMTCAHRTRPLGSLVTVSHNGRSIQCRVSGRGPFIRGRIIDVSVSAARALGMMHAGVVRVSLQ